MYTSKSTTSSERFKDVSGKFGDSVGWSQYEGSKKSHDINANQINVKNKQGEHVIYETKTGKMIYVGPNRD